MQLRAQCLVASGDHAAAQLVYKQLLQTHNPDDWSYLCGYLSASHHISKVADARDLLHVLQANETAKQSKRKRGPFLAELELECILRAGPATSEPAVEEAQPAPEPATQTVEAATVHLLVAAYFGMFGSKPCCYDDLKKYLNLFCGDGSADVATGNSGARTASSATTNLLEEMANSVLPVEKWEPESWPSEAAAWQYTCLCRMALTLAVPNLLCLGDISNRSREVVLEAINGLSKVYYKSLDTLQQVPARILPCSSVFCA
eukprot:SAG31_NODE_721_length_12587_cov_5.502002_3_plen_260_part_00